MSDEPLVAVRIKDGIFVGNAVAAHDDDFLMTNKISHVLNCAGSEVKDLFTGAGVHYLTFNWKDMAAMQSLPTPTGVMFDLSDNNIEHTVRFIDSGTAEGECVLVHDVNGTSRACALVAAYFISKYGWRIDNALAFMQMAHQQMEIKPHWMKQLRVFARNHDVDIDVFDPEVDDKRFSLDNDQWMLRNTLLNGLTANIQDSNALYQQCVKEVGPLEVTARAQHQKTRRRRIIFADTNQGTHVDSYTSTPVVQQAGGRGQHSDPNGTVGPHAFSGAQGIAAIIDGRRHVVESVVARRSPVNTRRLESTADVNAKGRQQLYRRARGGGTPHHEQQQPQQQHSVAGTTTNTSTATTPRGGHHAIGGGGPQQTSSYASNANATVQRMSTASTAARQQHDPFGDMTQRYGTPTNVSSGPHAVTPLRTSTTVQRHAPVATTTTAQHHRPQSPIGGATASSAAARRASGNDPMSSASSVASIHHTPLRGSSLVTPVKAPLRSSTSGTVRSPFSVGSGGVTARKGSPLPRQSTTSGGLNSSAAPSSARREVQSSGYGYGSVNRTSTTPSTVASRPNSPMSRLTTNNNSSSPYVQRPTTSTASRPQSPTQQRLATSGGASSTYHSSTTANSGVVRRAMSPRPNNVGSGSMGSSSTITGAGASSIQPAVRRANSPTTVVRTRIGSGASALQHTTTSGYTNNNMSAYSSAAASSAARPSSPMQRSTLATSGVRPNSPSRRPTSGATTSTLADQYLAGGSGGAHSTSGVVSRGLGTAGTGGSTSTALRRNSPTPITRRY